MRTSNETPAATRCIDRMGPNAKRCRDGSAAWLAVDYESDACSGATGEVSDRPGEVLARIVPGAAHHRDATDPSRIVVGLPLWSQSPRTSPDSDAVTDAPWCEVWRVPLVEVRGFDGDLGFVQGEDCLFAHLSAADDGSDLRALADDLYVRLLGFLASRGFPHPLRMWSYLPDIHRRVGGLERYRGFCVGRDRAFREAGFVPERFPAATAIGARAGGLLVYCLAGRTPGQPVENPRQVSAYRYPPRYGPRPPSFARALRLPGAGPLLVSGTAAVVGHRSCHPGDLAAQLHETLTNLDALACAAGMDGRWRRGETAPLLKVFLRDPAGLETVAMALERWSHDRARVLFLHGEICREELVIEIEGVLS